MSRFAEQVSIALATRHRKHKLSGIAIGILPANRNLGCCTDALNRDRYLRWNTQELARAWSKGVGARGVRGGCPLHSADSP